MYINQFPALTVKRMKEIFNTLSDDTEIIEMHFYNRDCQDIEGINNANYIFVQDETCLAEGKTIPIKEIEEE